MSDLQNEDSPSTIRMPSTREGKLVIGALLINAWQKRNQSIAELNSKIAAQKQKRDDSEKALVAVKKSIEETKAKKEAVYAELTKLKTELAVAKRGSKALHKSVKKVKEDQTRTLAIIEETKNQIKAKKDRVEALGKDLAEKQNIPQKLNSEYESVLQKIDQVIKENDELSETLKSYSEFACGELRKLKQKHDDTLNK